MAHIFLQQDPKVSVGNANDAPATIPTPEQLGSLLVTTDGAGGLGKIYAAVPAPVAPAWVSVGSGTGVGITGSGTLNRVAKFVGPGQIGDSQITDNGTDIAVTAAGGTVAVTGSDVTVDALVGNVVISAPATGAVSIQNPNANVTVGAGGSNNDVDIAASGDLTVNVTGGIGLNGALFLGAFAVGALPPGVAQAFAFATNVRNLDSGGVYPAIEAPAAGTGGLVVRFSDGTWRLAGTNITAQA